MAVFGSVGPQTPRPPDPPEKHDLSYEAAVEQTRIAYARLLHQHSLFWLIDTEGNVLIGCDCKDLKFLSWNALTGHIRDAVTAERGPKKR